MTFRAYHQAGEYPPSPEFHTLADLIHWMEREKVCVDGHNKDKVCDDCLHEWTIQT